MVAGCHPTGWHQLYSNILGTLGFPLFTLTLCHILHSVSHWPVLEYIINMLGPLSFGCLPAAASVCLRITMRITRSQNSDNRYIILP
jgi:hypothetical protein